MEDDLSRLAAATTVPDTTGGTPLLLALDSIDEDPGQPRQDFDADKLEEMAGTIRERGVRTPISVRPHPEQPGRWMLNFGARRLRASKLAGKTDIPAYVDATADSYDQVIENEQREALRPMELALFVQREMRAGQSQADVARRLGKSRSYITFICALIDPPDLLMTLYREGRCRGVKEIYDLRRLHENHADEVTEWLSSREFVSRGDVAALQEHLDAVSAEPALPTAAPAAAAPAPPASSPIAPAAERVPQTPKPVPTPVEPEPSASSKRAVVLEAEFDGVTVRVLLDPVPSQIGKVFVNTADAQARKAVAIESLMALRLVQR